MITYILQHKVKEKEILGIFYLEIEIIEEIFNRIKDKINISREELIKKIKKERGYILEDEEYIIDSYESPLNLYIAVYEDYEYSNVTTIGTMKSLEGIIALIEEDIRISKGIKDKNISKILSEEKSYFDSDSTWSYKIQEEKVTNQVQVYSCKEYYILKDFESNVLKAYENNGIFIYLTDKENLDNFKKIVERILNEGYGILKK